MWFDGLRSWLTRRSARGARAWLLHALAALVLLTQLASLQHSLQHERRDEGVAAHGICKLCLAFHVSDNVLATQLTTLVGLQAGHVLVSLGGQAQCAMGASVGFQPRAPPVLA